MRAPVPVDDAARVAALRRLGLLDQPPAADLEGVARIAAHVARAPFALVNLLDADRQWTAAASGLSCGSVPRDLTPCAHTVAADAPVHVPDASVDLRYADNPHVDGTLGVIGLYVSLPLHDHEGYVLGTLCVIDPRARPLDEEQLSVLGDLALQAEHLLELRRQHLALLDVLAEVDHYATHDHLTGLVNRRVLDDRLAQALARAERTDTPLTVFFCDVDGFKAVNDTHGHDAGDRVLVALGRALTEVVRPYDTVARLGGDEFVILCEGLPEEQVEVVAGRLRGALASHVRGLPEAAGLHLSVGAHRSACAAASTDVLGTADRLMYADKVRRGARAGALS